MLTQNEIAHLTALIREKREAEGREQMLCEGKCGRHLHEADSYFNDPLTKARLMNEMAHIIADKIVADYFAPLQLSHAEVEQIIEYAKVIFGRHATFH